MNTRRLHSLLIATLFAVPTIWLQAQDDAAPKLKPLPRFLRSAKLADRYLKTRDIDEILDFERAEPVCVQLLKRAGVDQKHRIRRLPSVEPLRGHEQHPSYPASSIVAPGQLG